MFRPPGHSPYAPLSLFRCIRTIDGLLEVHIGIAQGPAGAVIATNANRRDGSRRGEFIEQDGLGHIIGQVSDVQGRGMEVHVAGIHLALLRSGAHTIL